jgi:hypothetical protein
MNPLLSNNALTAKQIQLSPKWIRSILFKQCVITDDGAPELLQVTISDDIIKGGLVSRLNRIDLVWECNTDNSLPTTLIVKTLPPSLARDFLSLLLGCPREALFYNFEMEKAKHGKPSTFLPKIYYANGSMNRGNYCVIMEDLKHASRTSVLLGNQCWGEVPIVEPHEYILEQVFLSIADLHYTHWRDENLFKLDWLKSRDWLCKQNRASWEMCDIETKTIWRRVRHEATKESGLGWSSLIVETMDKAIENTTWESYHDNYNVNDKTTPFTLVHGDFHAGNCMWNKERTPPVYFYDWSEVSIGDPYTEIAQFMISNASIELRRKHERELLRKYYQKLVDLGIDSKIFTFDDAWERYVAGGTERWLQHLMIIAMLHFKYPEAIKKVHLRWYHDQVFAFLDDHLKSCRRPIILLTRYFPE